VGQPWGQTQIATRSTTLKAADSPEGGIEEVRSSNLLSSTVKALRPAETLGRRAFSSGVSLSLEASWH
jgi:hypothetical protein